MTSAAAARRTPRLQVGALGLALVLLLAGCSGGPGKHQARATPPQTTQPTSPSPSSLGTGKLKPMGAGLYSTARPRPGGPAVDHAVIGGNWADFEPRPGDFSGPGWDRVTAALRHWPNYKFRLRILAGRGSPGWVKQLSGGCVRVEAPASQIPSCVPRFWNKDFLRAYRGLMQEVARRYDSEPRILDVVDSACTTTWAEPFIRSGSNRVANLSLWHAGLNLGSDRHCFTQSMQDMDREFRSTRISLATHQVWQIIVGPADPKGMRTSWPEERALLNQLRSRYGAKLVVQNNGLGGNEGCRPGESLKNADSMWCWLASLSPPKGFQLEGNAKLSSRGFVVTDAVRQAVVMRGCFVEHNEFGNDRAAAAQLDQQLKANCPGSS